jgi:hypothetical protein
VTFGLRVSVPEEFYWVWIPAALSSLTHVLTHRFFFVFGFPEIDKKAFKKGLRQL